MTAMVLLCLLGAVGDGLAADFAMQAVAQRPRLEVRYTDASRTAFEVLGENYHVEGLLRKPHVLRDAASQAPWLALRVRDAAGKTYTASHCAEPSRINLYRRGPWYCEVHWFDVRVADGAGEPAPLKGDVALYCFPDKLLASIAWHGVGTFDSATFEVEGVAPAAFPMAPFEKGTIQRFALPLFGEEAPLADTALVSHEADAPLHYDATRGLYRIGSHNPGGFEGHFFDHPNHREQVRFTITNDGRPRTVYVCHETSSGVPGVVEGGVVLDEEGHPLPFAVQISKNFAGEKEEAFYNPKDIPFSENFFPLVLDANEPVTLTSIHLYQNWGAHMTKHFSSLGAWMDYFHSSTGVTETTCYVPFKYAGLPGVAIADFRAMSQPTFWQGQPQHDNIAGHSFLSYDAGQDWQYLCYRGTTYTSTGPNFMDIGFEYLSSDGAVRATVRTFELPQADELRNFINVKYEVLEPLSIKNAQENFRLLSVASWVQKLRLTHAAASKMPDTLLTFDEDHFEISGHPLPAENAFLALYGYRRGANAIVLRTWDAPFDAAMSVWCEENGNTRLLLTAGADTLELKPGDTIAFEAMWLPYGALDNAEAPRRETVAYGLAAPRVEAVARGKKLADFPAVVQADANVAELTIRGGRSLVPITVTGLADYRWPRICRKESTGWVPIPHARVGELDGVQVFSEAGGSFGAVFLVPSDDRPQQLRVTAGQAGRARPRITVAAARNTRNPREHAVDLQASWMAAPVRLRFPETVHVGGALDFIDHIVEGMEAQNDCAALAGQWNPDKDGTLSFEWKLDRHRIGGRVSPNEDDVDLEFWVENRGKEAVAIGTQFCPVLRGTCFEFGVDSLDRVFLHIDGAWKALADTGRGNADPAFCHYGSVRGPALPESLPEPWGASHEKADVDVAAVVSKDGKHVFAIAWPEPQSFLTNAQLPCVHADPGWPQCPPGRRALVRGKVYLMEGGLDDLLARVRRENIR